MALGLMAGIISDTGRFKRASAESFLAASELLEEGDLIMKRHCRPYPFPGHLSEDSRPQGCLPGKDRAAGRMADSRLQDKLLRGLSGQRWSTWEQTWPLLPEGMAIWPGSAPGPAREAAKGAEPNQILGDIGRSHGGDGGGHRAAACARGDR